MKILVIGGSYFLGRWFVQLAHTAHEVTVLNRGNVPVNLPGVKEIAADRHDVVALRQAAVEDYDCIVDFCAYAPGDIRTIAEVYGCHCGKYIFISTVDVYKRGTGQVLDESAPLEERLFPGPEGEYIAGKVALERELSEVCAAYGIRAVSVRPVILYGPANYAPREKLYFDWIAQAGQIISPTDATGRFQLLYVVDAAKMILQICAASAPEAAYNLCSDELTTYDSFAKTLHKISPIPFEEVPVTVEMVMEQQIPLPFPLTAESSEIYCSTTLETLGIPFTPLAEGLKKSQP